MKRSPILSWLKSKRVAVLKGGWSRERSISLKTGQAMEQALKRLRVRFQSIDVQPTVATALKKRKPQFCFIALHGPFGEDGQIQSVLDVLGIPYSGSGPMASSLAMNKATAKVLFQDAKVPTAPWMVLSQDQWRSNDPAPRLSLKKFLKTGPLFVKPVDQGSAVGASPVFNQKSLAPALNRCFQVGQQALIERAITGRELTVGVLGKKALPVIEIIPQHRFYDFHSKYAKGGSRHLVPAPLPSGLAKKIQSLSLKAFNALGCTAYGRVDLLLSKKGRISFLEVNTIPGLTPTSLLPEAAQAIGLDFDSLVLKIAEHSLAARKGRRARG